MLRAAEVPPLVIIELNEQTVEVVALEVDVEGVPLTVGAVVVEESLAIRIISRCLSHGHLHRTCAYWALQQPLTLILLRLRLINSQHIVAKLAIKVVDFLFQTESTQSLLTLHAKVHLLENELAVTAAFVVNEW